MSLPKPSQSSKARPLSEISLDLRRRLDTDRTRLLLTRAAWLPPAERWLIEGVYLRHLSLKELASLNRTPARTLRRRIRWITLRMLTPEFAYVALHRGGWRPQLKAIATACFIEGQALRTTARRMNIPYHDARSLRAAVQAMVDGAGRARAAGIPDVSPQPANPSERRDHAA